MSENALHANNMLFYQQIKFIMISVIWSFNLRLFHLQWTFAPFNQLVAVVIEETEMLEEFKRTLPGLKGTDEM